MSIKSDDSSSEEEQNSIQKFQSSTASDITCMIPKNPEIDVVVNTSKTPKEIPKLDSSEAKKLQNIDTYVAP